MGDDDGDDDDVAMGAGMTMGCDERLRVKWVGIGCKYGYDYGWGDGLSWGMWVKLWVSSIVCQMLQRRMVTGWSGGLTVVSITVGVRAMGYGVRDG